MLELVLVHQGHLEDDKTIITKKAAWRLIADGLQGQPFVGVLPDILNAYRNTGMSQEDTKIMYNMLKPTSNGF